MTFRNGIPEPFAIEAARLATTLPPMQFLGTILPLIAQYSDWKCLSYFAATKHHGIHLQSSVNLPAPSPTTAISWQETEFAALLESSLGEPIVLADKVVNLDIETTKRLQAWRYENRLKAAAAIASTGILPGQVDALIIYEDLDCDKPITDADNERLWQTFTAIRLGLKVSIDSYVARKSWSHSNGAFALVDQHGYFISDNFDQIDIIKNRLEKSNPESLINGKRLSFDRIAPQLEMSGRGYLSGLEIFQADGLFEVAVSRNAILANMSPREREIAELIAAGQSYKSIAASLNIAFSTVSNISVRIRSKLGLTRKEEIAVLLNSVTAQDG